MKRDNQALAEKFLGLVSIMDELREKCPWDRKQTIQSLRSMTIEETYELADAIDLSSWTDIKEELGDILLHLLFYARIASENQSFTIEEVIEGITAKMINRHPHIYGDTVVKDEEDVKRNWQKIKLKEGKTSVFSGVPKALPALVKAARIQEKARQVGFDWSHRDQVFEKVQEELGELQEAIAVKAQADVEEGFGDLMFSLINYARFLKVDPETALEKCNRKFIHRFQEMEAQAEADGNVFSALDLEGMDRYWNLAKESLKQKLDDTGQTSDRLKENNEAD